MTICAFPGCDREHVSRGYCAGHYKQYRDGRDLAPLRQQVSRQDVADKTPEIIRLWQSDRLSTGQIAEQVGLSQAVVLRALKRAGVHDGKRQALTAPHGAPARWMAGCRCAECVEGRREYKRAEHERHGSYLTPEELRQQSAERQRRSSETAERTRTEWTGPEVEIAVREDLTIEQIAQRLGRTFAAVSNVRAALADPDHVSHYRYRTLLDGS